MEKLVSHVGIINKGQLIYQGTLGQLMAKRQQALQIVWDTSDSARAMEVLNGRHAAQKLDESKLVTPDLTRMQIGAVNRELVEAGVAVYEISGNNKDLESIFINLIGN
jgi:lantibiotic transport system ATP-binding protein